MNEVGPIWNRLPAGSPAETERAASERDRRLDPTRPGQPAADRVELSEAAIEHNQEAQAARAMEQRIGEIRARIADGTYLTPDKIDIALQRLYEELSGSESPSRD